MSHPSQLYNRPFMDRDEMDKTMIERWNSKVSQDDDVFIIGDFAHRNYRDEAWYLRQLIGHKHLVIGNHDSRLLNNERTMKHFESVERITGIHDYLEGEKVSVILCHYPLAEWYKSRHGSWHIYGHIHGDTGITAKYMTSIEHALNAGVVINNYAPASLNELIENNRIFRNDVLNL